MAKLPCRAELSEAEEEQRQGLLAGLQRLWEVDAILGTHRSRYDARHDRPAMSRGYACPVQGSAARPARAALASSARGTTCRFS